MALTNAIAPITLAHRVARPAPNFRDRLFLCYTPLHLEQDRTVQEVKE